MYTAFDPRNVNCTHLCSQLQTVVRPVRTEERVKGPFLLLLAVSVPIATQGRTARPEVCCMCAHLGDTASSN